MKTSTLPAKPASIIFLLMLLLQAGNAQVVRSYTNIYSDNIHGGHTIIGNTLSAIYTSGSGSTGIINTTAMNDFSTSGTGNYTYGRTSAYGNDNSNIQLVDIDGIAQTTNSSSATLSLPAGTNTIRFARIYWGGRISGGTGGANNINLRSAKIRFNSESYQTITAAPGAIDKSVVNGTDSTYQAFADITSFVNARGAGTYYMADVTAATGSISNGGHFAGWALVVVYENPSLSYCSVRVFDGFLQVYDGGSSTTQTITLNGLNPPATFSLSSDAYMSTVSWEGDANLAASAANPAGDFVKVNGTAVSNEVNPVTNFWNGTISKNGAHIRGNKNPDFLNQMGIDIDEMEVGTGFGISPATTNVNVEFGTEADQYFPAIFAFTMKTKPPLVQLDKIIRDTASGNAPWQIPNNMLNPNEIVTYTITGKNMGSGNALNCVITDTIPTGLSYRAGSLKVNAPTPGVNPGFMTDAPGDDAASMEKAGSKTYLKFYIGTGASHNTGGKLMPQDSFNVQFQCVAPANANALTFVSNTARITGTEQDGVTPFVDDGTAIIGPQGGGVPVKLSSFTVKANYNAALLEWVTSSELMNDHFDVERSTDAINFNKIGTVRGNGTVTTEQHYQFLDPLGLNFLIVYYRLASVDMDGKPTYSKIVSLRPDELMTMKNLSIYPNPFHGDFRLLINSGSPAVISIRLSNATGQPQGTYQVSLSTGENIIVIKNLENLAPGIYYAEIFTDYGIYARKLLKN